MRFIAAHYGNPITVRDVADAACLSEDRLAHVFRDSTGFSVKDYVTRFRVAIARRLLAETTETLDTIADRLGFAHASHLSRSFKHVHGVRPGEFRRSALEGLTLMGGENSLTP
jgi:AraC-like DNA-binding protein